MTATEAARARADGVAIFHVVVRKPGYGLIGLAVRGVTTVEEAEAVARKIGHLTSATTFQIDEYALRFYTPSQIVEA